MRLIWGVSTTAAPSALTMAHQGDAQVWRKPWRVWSFSSVQVTSGHVRSWDRWMPPGTPTVIVGPQSVLTWGSPPDITTNNIAHLGGQGVCQRTYGHSRARGCVAQRGSRAVAACVFPAAIAPHAGLLSIAGNTLVDELMNGVVYHYQRRYYISALDIVVLAGVGLLVDEIFKGGFQ